MANDEFSQLPALANADVRTINQFVRELNLRLRRISEKIDQRSSSRVKLTADMDAGFKRLTKVATAVSLDDAMPLGQFREEFDRLQKEIAESLVDADQSATTTEGDTTDPGDVDDDDIQAALDDAAAINPPPEIAFQSQTGTPEEPIRFALENHTHGGFRTHFLIMGA